MKILVLAGDHWHSHDILFEGLDNAFSELGWDADFYLSHDVIAWNELSKYNVFILAQWGKIKYDDSSEENRWMKPELEEKIASYVEGGGGFIAFHSALSDHSTLGIYRKISKGHFLFHPEKLQMITIDKLAISHPISRGIEQFSILDEQYFVEVDENDTDIILNGSSTSGRSHICWAHQHGLGRVCALTPGHTKNVLAHPTIKKLICNAVLWCADKPV